MPGNEASDPPAEPALTVDSREELVYLLQVLSRYYIQRGETAAEFDTLARTAKLHSMSQDITAHASKPASRRQRQDAVPDRRALTEGEISP